MTDSNDLALTVGAHVAATAFSDLDPPTIHAAKRSVLDAIGVSLAAGGLEPSCLPFIELAMEAGGAQESTVVGFQRRVPCAMAAFANGSMAHAVDFEDQHDAVVVHPHAAVVPAALALGEAAGTSGRDFLAAVAVGADLVCRLGAALTVAPSRYGWFLNPVLGSLGAAAASAKVLRLSADQVVDAMSLTMCQAAMSGEFNASPQSDLRAIRDAFMAQAGVLGARLAQRGVRGFEQVFEGERGFFALYARGNYDRTRILDRLGVDFQGAGVSFKPWPTCRGTHGAIQAALELRGQAAERLDEITHVRATIPADNVNLCEPFPQKSRPRTAIDAKFSLPFTIATALIRGRVSLDDFTGRSLLDRRVLDLASRFEFVVDHALGREQTTWASVELLFTDGSVRSAHVLHDAYGHPSDPLSDADLVVKFADCARRAATPLREAVAVRLAKKIMRLEDLDDVGDLWR